MLRVDTHSCIILTDSYQYHPLEDFSPREIPLDLNAPSPPVISPKNVEVDVECLETPIRRKQRL